MSANPENVLEPGTDQKHTDPEDLNVGSFSKNAPWIIDRASMKWLKETPVLRFQLEKNFPALVKRPLVPPAKRMARLVFESLLTLGPYVTVDRRRQNSRYVLTSRIKDSFKRLGPTFIKLGQILSAGKGIFPDEVVDQFTLLRDKVDPVDFSEVLSVIRSELNQPINQVFEYIDPHPIAAASIAQVHRAKLTSGEHVVIKVQRPGIEKKVLQDLELMCFVSPLLVGRIPIAALANPPALVELFASTIVEELDFRLEAENMLDIAKVLAESNQRSVIVPRPHPELVTKRLLVMEEIKGTSFNNELGLRELKLNLQEVIRAVLISFLEGCLIYGVFHGDLHGGNMLVTDDGKVALLDFGITGRLTERSRIAFLKLLVGASTNQLEPQIEALIDIGALPANTDPARLIHELGLNQQVVDPTKLSAEDLAKEAQRIVKGLLGHGARLPKELMLYGKNMLFIDWAIGTLVPDIDILKEIMVVVNYFNTKYGNRIAAESGLQFSEEKITVEGYKGSFGLEPEVASLTHRDVQERRKILAQKFEEAKKRGRKKHK